MTNEHEPGGKARRLGMTIPEFPKVADISYNQEQICLLEAFYPKNQAYNFQATVEIEGDLDICFLERALEYVIDRHEMLRTTIALGESGYRATVHPPYSFIIASHDLSQEAPEAQNAKIEALRHEITDRTFDVSKLPLFDLQAVRLGEKRWILIQIEHHAIHDGWSLSKLWSEIQTAYSDLSLHKAPNLPPLPAQYQQFVGWQRSKMSGDYGDKALEFWSRYLDGAGQDIGLGHLPPPGISLEGHNLEISLPPDVFAAIGTAARSMAVSNFVLMFSVFSRLLAIKTGADDFSIGTAVNARTERCLEPIIGMIVNTVPVRVRPTNGIEFEDLCRHVQNSLFQTLKYQDVPLSLIVRKLGVAQMRGRNPIFQHCFSFHDSNVPKLELGRSPGRIRERQNQASKFDINVVVIPPNSQRGTSETRMFWQFSAGLFSPDDAQNIAHEYVALLRELISVKTEINPPAEMSLPTAAPIATFERDHV